MTQETGTATSLLMGHNSHDGMSHCLPLVVGISSVGRWSFRSSVYGFPLRCRPGPPGEGFGEAGMLCACLPFIAGADGRVASPI
jgi:hypothetical protein